MVIKGSLASFKIPSILIDILLGVISPFIIIWTHIFLFNLTGYNPSLFVFILVLKKSETGSESPSLSSYLFPPRFPHSHLVYPSRSLCKNKQIRDVPIIFFLTQKVAHSIFSVLWLSLNSTFLETTISSEVMLPTLLHSCIVFHCIHTQLVQPPFLGLEGGSPHILQLQCYTEYLVCVYFCTYFHT